MAGSKNNLDDELKRFDAAKAAAENAAGGDDEEEKEEEFKYIKVAGISEPAKKELFKITVKDGDMKAFLLLLPPDTEKGEKDLTQDEISEALAKYGINTGINESAISAMLDKHIYGREELIAEGTYTTEGVNGYFDYFFPVEETDKFGRKKKKKPEIRTDGSVDYTSVNLIYCVNEGDKLATYHPAVKGKPGVTVRGRVINPKGVRDLKPYFTVNCSYDEETYTYTAECAGRVELGKARLAVLDIQEFKRDIDIVFGNINFKGDVIIHGSVLPGVHIQATKSITIDKVLEGATVVAGGDVIIKGGVMGNGSTKIESGGDVFADFIEYAKVDAKGSVSANIIWDSEVNADFQVHATGKVGAIIGGEVYGAAGVDAAYIGNDVGVKTIVSAGVKDVYARQMKLYEKAIDSIDRTLVTLEEELDEAERSVRLGTADELMTKHVQSLRREKIQKTSEQKETTTKIEKLKTLVAGSAGAQIIVKNTAYNGSIFILGEQQYVVEEERRQIKFVIDDKDNMIIKPLI